MIDELDRRLAAWVQSIHKKVKVSFDLPKDDASGSGVVLFPFDLAADPLARGPKRPPIRIRVRYWVSAWADKPEEAHRLVGDLAFSALDHAEYEVETEAAPAGFWGALGIAPRLGFLLKAPLRRERPERLVPLVRKPLVFRTSSLRPVLGAVLGPGKVPIMGARVEFVSSGVSAITDRHGRFAFPPMPADEALGTLRVSAKGRTLELTVTEKHADPIVVRLEPLEP